MRVVISSEYHFTQTAEGIFAEGLYGYPFWQRYLAIFSEVVVIARGTIGQAPGSGQVLVTGPGVQVCLIPSVRGAELVSPRVAAGVMRQARVAFSKPAVLLFRAPGVVPLLLSPLVPRALALGVQVVGDPLESMQSAGKLGRWLAPVFARHLAWLTKRADATLYVTSRTLQGRYPMAAGKPTFASSDLELPPALWAAPMPAQGDGPALALGFVGMLDRDYKGLDVLLAALAKTRAMHTLMIAGDGLLRARYEQQAADLGLQARVQWLGAVPSGAAVHETMRRCELFVLPSRTEGMPRVLLEAMAVGLPCLATPVGGVPEVLPPAALVPVDDAAALAAQLDAWGASKTLREAHATANRRAVQTFEKSAVEARIHGFWRALRDAGAAAQ